MAQDKDPIGFDPVKWVQRLRDVNSGSQFRDDAKITIEARLRELQGMLEKMWGHT